MYVELAYVVVKECSLLLVSEILVKELVCKMLMLQYFVVIVVVGVDVFLTANLLVAMKND